MRVAAVLSGLVAAALGLWMAMSRDPAAKAAGEARPKIGLPPPGKTAILVTKSARRLALFVDGREVYVARVALGQDPGGHKQREGDRRTPEGDYYICTRNDQSRFHLFLGLSYPGLEDAEAGFRDGRITREERDEIAAAIRGRRQPPWKTPLGGEVGIHGKGAGRDWTLGCVALDDAGIEVLWKHCPLGTPVRIEP